VATDSTERAVVSATPVSSRVLLNPEEKMLLLVLGFAASSDELMLTIEVEEAEVTFS